MCEKKKCKLMMTNSLPTGQRSWMPTAHILTLERWKALQRFWCLQGLSIPTCKDGPNHHTCSLLIKQESCLVVFCRLGEREHISLGQISTLKNFDHGREGYQISFCTFISIYLLVTTLLKKITFKKDNSKFVHFASSEYNSTHQIIISQKVEPSARGARR